MKLRNQRYQRVTLSSAMNTTCRLLLTFSFLATFESQAAGRLLIKPRDTDAKANHLTYFNCSTDIGSTAIFWYHGKKFVYTGNVILEPYQQRFEVDKSEWNGTYIYNLVIHSVQPGDAGEYRCEEDEGFGEKYSVQLVVLDDDPICRSNMELDEVIGQNSCNIEPDEVELECSVRYHGNIPPQMEWKRIGRNSTVPMKVSVVSSLNQYTSTLKLKGDIALNNTSYICGSKRMTQKRNNCTSKIINILYALSDNFTVNRTTDDEIHCSANTSQSCSYKWRWVQDNDVTTESSTAVLKARKPGLHRCEAECLIRNKTCNLLVMRAMVSDEQITESSQTRSIIISVVVVVTVAAAAVFALIVVLVKRHTSDWWCFERKTETPTMDDLMSRFEISELEARQLDGWYDTELMRKPPKMEDGIPSDETSETDPLREDSIGNFDTDFFSKHLNPTHCLHKGPFKYVYGPIEWKGMRLAIKQDFITADKFYKEFRNQIQAKQQMWKSLDHEHITRIYSVDLSQLPKAFNTLMEYAAGGSLKLTLQSVGCRRKLPIDVVTDWAKQIAKGMQYLHEKNIIHRILKSSNILLAKKFDVQSPSKSTVKITDVDEFKDFDQMVERSFVGNFSCMAPEVLADQRFSKAGDVWSFGVLIWEMLSGNIPHKGMQASEIIDKSRKGELHCLPIASSFPESYKFILKKCWKSKCEERLSFEQILDLLDPTAIYALTILHQEVFVSRAQRSIMEVYDSTTFSFKRKMTVTGMYERGNIASCSVNNCLYIAGSRYEEGLHAIMRIDPLSGNLIKAWKSAGGQGQHSVASDTNVISCSFDGYNLYEYTADGELIRTINFYHGLYCTEYDGVGHAVKLGNGVFIFCHSWEVYLLSANETSRTSGRVDKAEILRKFSEESCGSNVNFSHTAYLSVNKEGSILISDTYGDQVLLSNSKFDKRRILISKEYGIESPKRSCFNESTREWLVTDGYQIFACRVEGETIERKIHNLFGY